MTLAEYQKQLAELRREARAINPRYYDSTSYQQKLAALSHRATLLYVGTATPGDDDYEAMKTGYMAFDDLLRRLRQERMESVVRRPVISRFFDLPDDTTALLAEDQSSLSHSQ